MDTQAELLSAAAAAAASHTHAASDIASGSFATGRLADGTATAGFVPISDGDGTSTWGAVASGTLTILSKTTDYTATTSDQYIRCNHASTAFTITLPAATGSGRMLRIKNIGAANVTADADGTDTIDGAPTLVLPQYACATLVDAASGTWDIV